MTPSEARAWIAATARSRTEWQLDQIHNTIDDAILYKGGENGYFVTLRQLYQNGPHPSLHRRWLNQWLVEIGTYDGALPHIGEACFTVMGRKPFTSPDYAVRFISDKVTKVADKIKGYMPALAETIVPRDQEDPDPADERFHRLSEASRSEHSRDCRDS